MDDVETVTSQRKTRRSRRGGYRRKRQQQKKVAALIAESAARRANEEKLGGIDDSSTATTEGESSSCESTVASLPPKRTAARKRGKNNLHQQQRHGMDSINDYHRNDMSNPDYQYAGPTGRYNTYPTQSTSFSRSKHALSTEQFVALDCEMVGVGEHGATSVLARVTIINWDGFILMDELVKPKWPVTDYRTFVSGITKEMLDNAQMSFATVRKNVLKILRNKILVGHGLNNDLKVLGISHPWHMIRDTALYEPFMKVRFHDGALWPRALKDLCKEMLHRDVQVYGRPHCPKEDALAALDLYRLVGREWEQYMMYNLNCSGIYQRQQVAE